MAEDKKAVPAEDEAQVEVTPAETVPAPQAPEATIDVDALPDELVREIVGKRWDVARAHEKVNAEVQSLTAKRVQREKQVLQERDLQAQSARQFMASWEAMPVERRLEFLQNPQTAARYHQAKATASQSGAGQETWAKNLLDNFGTTLQQTEGFEDLPYDEISGEYADNPVGWLQAIVKHKSEKEKKNMEKELEAKFTALKNELKADMLKGSEQPEPVQPLGEPGGRTWEQIEQAYADGEMSTKQYEQALEAHRESI